MSYCCVPGYVLISLCFASCTCVSVRSVSVIVQEAEQTVSFNALLVTCSIPQLSSEMRFKDRIGRHSIDFGNLSSSVYFKLPYESLFSSSSMMNVMDISPYPVVGVYIFPFFASNCGVIGTPPHHHQGKHRVQSQKPLSKSISVLVGYRNVATIQRTAGTIH